MLPIPVATAAAIVESAPAAHGPVTSPAVGVSVGEVVVDAPLAEVRAALADVKRWPAIFSDVARVEVVDDKNAIVHSGSMGRGSAVRFTGGNDRLVHVVTIEGDKNGDMVLDFTLEPVTATTTKITERLQVSLPAPWRAIGELVARPFREKKLQADLVDLQRAFVPARP